MRTLRYYETAENVQHFTWNFVRGDISSKLIDPNTYLVKNGDGETALLHGHFYRDADGKDIAGWIDNILFRDADGNKVARYEAMDFDQSGQTAFNLHDVLDSARFGITRHIGSIGDDHISTWSYYATEVYALAGDDVVQVTNRALFYDIPAKILDGGLGEDTLDFSKLIDREVEPHKASITVLASDGLFKMHGSSGAIAHFEKYVGTRYADAFYGSAADETFEGRGGRDDITGGGGADQFVFGMGSKVDLINDFEIGHDKIVIRGDLGFDNFDQLQDFTTTQSTADGKIVSIDFGIKDVLMIALNANDTLSASDFIFDV